MIEVINKPEDLIKILDRAEIDAEFAKIPEVKDLVTLNEKLKQKNILQIELDKTSKAIESAQNELSALLNTTKRNKLALQELSERLEKKERYLNNIEVVTMNKLSKINREIELKQSTINEKISEKENKINKLESYLI